MKQETSVCVCVLQVFDVVREQITRALQYQMTQLDQFRNKLGHLSYQDITNLWQAERTAKEKDEMLATPIQYVNMLYSRVYDSV